MCSWVEPVHLALVVYMIRQDQLPASQPGSIKRTVVPLYMCSWVEPVHQALVVYMIRQEQLHSQAVLKGLTPHYVRAPG